MILDPILEWLIFGAFGFIAIAGALGMATTMSMFRSGVFLMASFVGVAGLFILLSADLLSLLQIMMYIGGMLVMILFMVLFSHDPGGAMMAGMMELPAVERFFSLGLAAGDHHGNGGGKMEHGSSADEQGGQNRESHSASSEDGHNQEESKTSENSDKEKHNSDEGGGMDMGEMSMTTPLKPYAAILATALGILLVALLLLRPAWPVVDQTPDSASARQVGSLLMGKYMIAFEGAGLLILLGIVGAVFISRPAEFPDAGGRGHRVSVDAPPARIESVRLAPLAALRDAKGTDEDDITGAHRDAPPGEIP